MTKLMGLELLQMEIECFELDDTCHKTNERTRVVIISDTFTGLIESASKVIHPDIVDDHIYANVDIEEFECCVDDEDNIYRLFSTSHNLFPYRGDDVYGYPKYLYTENKRYHINLSNEKFSIINEQSKIIFDDMYKIINDLLTESNLKYSYFDARMMLLEILFMHIKSSGQVLINKNKQERDLYKDKMYKKMRKYLYKDD